MRLAVLAALPLAACGGEDGLRLLSLQDFPRLLLRVDVDVLSDGPADPPRVDVELENDAYPCADVLPTFAATFNDFPMVVIHPAYDPDFSCGYPRVTIEVTEAMWRAESTVALSDDHSRPLQIDLGNALVPRVASLTDRSTWLFGAGETATLDWAPSGDFQVYPPLVTYAGTPVDRSLVTFTGDRFAFSVPPSPTSGELSIAPGDPTPDTVCDWRWCRISVDREFRTQLQVVP